MESHTKEEQLRRFLEGRSEGSQARVLVAHLLSGFPACSEHAKQLIRPTRKLPPNAYDAAFEKALFRVQARRAPRPRLRLQLQQGVAILPGSPI